MSEIDLEYLNALAAMRSGARERELKQKRLIARMTADLETSKGQTLAAAYADGTIDGKNQGTRDRQEADVLAKAEHVAAQIVNLHQAEETLEAVQVEREYHDDVVALTRAWLYSQCRL